MSDSDDKEKDLNRSVVEFKAQYNVGVHTKGRKKKEKGGVKSGQFIAVFEYALSGGRKFCQCC